MNSNNASLKVMSGSLAALGVLAGSVFTITFMILMIFSIPFSTVAVMHLFGWQWWSALILSTFVNMIPFIGTIVQLVFTCMGLYYLYDANWDWSLATTPRSAIYSGRESSEGQFAEYKRTILRPQVLAACMNEAKESYALNGKVPAAISNYCDCYARTIAEVTTQDDLIKADTYRIKAAIRGSCQTL